MNLSERVAPLVFHIIIIIHHQVNQINEWIIVVGSRSVVGKNGGGGWWWRVAWGGGGGDRGGHDGGGSDDDDDVKAAAATTKLALLFCYWSVCWRWGESELCVRLKQPHLTAHSLHSFFLSHTHCDDHVEHTCMHAWWKQTRKHSHTLVCITHYLIHIFIHISLICLYAAWVC